MHAHQHHSQWLMCVIRPHRGTSVPSVCNDCEPCKNGWTDWVAIWDVDLMNYVLDGVQISTQEGALLGGWSWIFMHAHEHHSQWLDIGIFWHVVNQRSDWLVAEAVKCDVKFSQWKIFSCNAAVFDQLFYNWFWYLTLCGLQFPLCDGAHNEHNEATGDNVGPLVLKNRDKWRQLPRHLPYCHTQLAVF